MQTPLSWQGFWQWAFLIAAFCFLMLTGWRWERRRNAQEGSARAELGAFIVSGAWALVVAGTGYATLVAQVFESFRTFAWLSLAFVLFSRDGRHTSVAPIRPVMAALIFVETLQFILLMLNVRYGGEAAA